MKEFKPLAVVPTSPISIGGPLPFYPGAGLFLLRVLIGLGLLRHGFGKWGHMEEFARGISDMGFPLAEQSAWAAMLSEFLGGILLILGWKTRVASFFVAATMSVAVFIKHAQDPFQMKELALGYLVAALVLSLGGPGRWSLDKSERNIP